MKLVWFRRDLRAVDNTALNAAIESGEPVLALFVATPHQWQQHHMSPKQADLIVRRLHDLKHELDALNIPLLYKEVHNFTESAECVATLAKQLSANEVLVNQEYEINEQQRDILTYSKLSEHGIKSEAKRS